MLDLTEKLPFATDGDSELASPESFAYRRRYNKVPRYWYYTLRVNQKPIRSGGIPASNTGGGTKDVYLTPYPLGQHDIVVDITKLNEEALSFSKVGSNDTIYHRGDIPAHAVVAYDQSAINPPEVLGTPKTVSVTAAAVSEGPKEFRIHENNIPWLDKHFARMSKVATEVGSKPPTYTQVRDEFVPRYKKDENGHFVLGGIDGKGEKVIDGYDHYLYITVQGEPPKLAGWTFVASLTHTKTGNLINHAPGQVMDVPEKYRSGEPWCDYCETSRRRTDSFIVKSDKGEYKQIGRNCLAKFLGYSNPERVANYAEWLNNLDSNLQGEMDEEEEKSRGGWGGEDYEDLEGFLSMVAAVTRLKGWVTKTQAEATNKMPSIVEVKYQLEPSHPGDRNWPKNRITPTAEDTKRAKEAIAFARSDKLKTDTDFKSNLKVATAADFFHRKAEGVVAALISFQNRDKEWEIQQEMRRAETDKRKAEQKKSEFLGEVGERLKDITVRVILQKNLESDFGVSFLYKMVDTSGNLLTWFASNPMMEQGRWYKLTGTIKKQETYQDVKQTVVTRCKVEEIDPPAGFESTKVVDKDHDDFKKAIADAVSKGPDSPKEELAAYPLQGTLTWKKSDTTPGVIHAYHGSVPVMVIAQSDDGKNVHYAVWDNRLKFNNPSGTASSVTEAARYATGLWWPKAAEAGLVPAVGGQMVEEKPILEALGVPKMISKDKVFRKPEPDVSATQIGRIS